MAIYHCSAHNIARSSGRTATAAAAYRAGEKIKDERTGIVHDYTKKQGIEHTEIVSNLGISIDRARLWNQAEQAENRKDSRTAKEFVIALPHELNAQDRQAAALAFARHLTEQYGCVADVAIHAPSRHSEDDRNHHAHIMITTRKATLDQGKNLIFQEKTDLELSNSKRKQLGLGTTENEILRIRQTWEQIANIHLEAAGKTERIDHRSYQEQGNGKIAQIHETPQVTAMRRKGKETEISRQNTERKDHNARVEQEARQEKEQQKVEILAAAQNRLEARLAERAAQREKQAAAEREAREQQKQSHSTGFER